MRVKIVIENNKSRIFCTRKLRMWLREQMKIRAKGYFFSVAYRRRQWDGFVQYISEENGMFSTGLLEQIITLLGEKGKKWEIQDNRDNFKPIRDLDKVGKKELFEHNKEALDEFFAHKIGGIRFQRGIMAEATNAGKSVIAAGIFGSYADKRIGILLTNSKTLYEQTVKDLKKIFGNDVGEVCAARTYWKRINVCMVQTLSNRIKKEPKYKTLLAKTDIIIVDEADELIGRQDCKLIMGVTYNAPVRVAFSGTALKNKGKLKDKRVHGGSTRNQDQIAFFGPVIHSITNRDLVDKGISTPPIITIHSGNKEIAMEGDYQYEYEKGIIKNKYRHWRVWHVVNDHLKNKRLPILILYKIHKHGRLLLKRIPLHIKEKYKVELIHSKSAHRVSAIRDLNKGKLDILICSMIVRRGINIPRMKALVNAAGGDTETNVLQIFGRALRKHHKKDVVYIDDFFDRGAYLQRHSKHRVKFYKDQKFEVLENYKKDY